MNGKFFNQGNMGNNNDMNNYNNQMQPDMNNFNQGMNNQFNNFNSNMNQPINNDYGQGMNNNFNQGFNNNQYGGFNNQMQQPDMGGFGQQPMMNNQPNMFDQNPQMGGYGQQPMMNNQPNMFDQNPQMGGYGQQQDMNFNQGMQNNNPQMGNMEQTKSYKFFDFGNVDNTQPEALDSNLNNPNQQMSNNGVFSQFGNDMNQTNMVGGFNNQGMNNNFNQGMNTYGQQPDMNFNQQPDMGGYGQQQDMGFNQQQDMGFGQQPMMNNQQNNMYDQNMPMNNYDQNMPNNNFNQGMSDMGGYGQQPDMGYNPQPDMGFGQQPMMNNQPNNNYDQNMPMNNNYNPAMQNMDNTVNYGVGFNGQFNEPVATRKEKFHIDFKSILRDKKKVGIILGASVALILIITIALSATGSKTLTCVKEENLGTVTGSITHIVKFKKDKITDYKYTAVTNYETEDSAKEAEQLLDESIKDMESIYKSYNIKRTGKKVTLRAAMDLNKLLEDRNITYKELREELEKGDATCK